MNQFHQQKIQAWSEHSERFSCEHENKILSKRVVKGGAVQFVYQCQRCGEVALQAVARAKALALGGGTEPLPFDPKLQEEWSRLRAESSAVIEARFNEKFWSGYTVYLRSPEWAERRSLVLKRARGVCEACGKNQPAEVHHLTYDHVGQEFLFELVAVCHECHARLHPEEAPDEPSSSKSR